MIVCAGASEQFSFAKPIGIGLVDSTIALTRLCLECKPEHLLFVGSAGSYGKLSLLEACVSTHARNLEGTALLQKAYSPLSLNISHHSPYVSRETLPQVVVNSSNYITADEALCTEFLAAECAVENMEFYAVLRVAEMFNIPAFGLFVVTNYCHKDAHKAFLANHQEAKARLEFLVHTHWKHLQ
ncbi:purine-nucleoside phosphorylase [Sulfurospirillum sp. T05]|uniref:Purine-nucleoside phosphorylase n=1 Tax=Sulfurospirillum tamanense TaxID=2813362 RepID=A0ABS2WQV8_9BACT|nr:purine-nucleoside phosphorylase [Sulfurospirillum tamanensis]MBN2964061.1 purine-nucleoside phosphorylase [Sulfurospirillum tamanensis]